MTRLPLAAPRYPRPWMRLCASDSAGPLARSRRSGKHRDTAGKARYGTLGWIAIPNIFLFQIILPLVSPVIDFLFLLSLALWGLGRLRFARLPELWTSQDVERSLIFFALFMLIDLLTCVIAFALEKDEDWTLLAPLILQRFYYRQMMYVVLFRAIREALRGRPVGWRGVETHLSAFGSFVIGASHTRRASLISLWQLPCFH